MRSHRIGGVPSLPMSRLRYMHSAKRILQASSHSLRSPLPIRFIGKLRVCADREWKSIIYSTLSPGVRCRLLTGLLAAILAQSGSMLAEPINVHYPEGSVHGFLVLRTLDGNVLAAGDFTQTVHGHRIVAQLVFHFKDGSMDEETAAFSQNGTFRLISDHRIQKGPRFPKPMDIFINASTGQVTVHYSDKGGKKVKTDHLDLPPDLANGIIPVILKNISPDTKETKVSYVAATPEPKLVHLSITPQGKDTFFVAGDHRKATRFRVTVDIGGIAGLIAPLMGKQPADTYVWISGGKVPAFVKLRGPQYLNGPIWNIDLECPVWGRLSHSDQ